MPKAEGMAVPSALSPELIQIPAAQGAIPLENPTALLSHYGFAADGPMVPAANAVQGKDNKVEATKTEPDKNTYLVLDGQKGPDAGYDYGTHFLFQGHEVGPKTADGKPQSLLTRINLDADFAHRVTLMGDTVSDGNPLPPVDGSTWDPFAKRILLTVEAGDKGGLWQATADFPSKIDNLSGVAGAGGYEGVQVDPDGTIWIVEDVGGKAGASAKHAKQPNSFVYRFTPKDKADLAKGGKLEALQIMDASGQPIVFHDGAADADITSQGMKDLHTYGNVLKTKWVLLHDSDKDGIAPFSANALAKKAGATPLKRPENGLFRPGSNFTEFVFDETGDTNADTEAGSGIWRVRRGPVAEAGGTVGGGGRDQARLSRRRRPHRLRQPRLLVGKRGALRRGPRRRPARPEERARLRLRHRPRPPTTPRAAWSRSASSPKAATRWRRSTPASSR